MSGKAARSTRTGPSYTVSLRIRHPSIDPAEISRQLGLQPDYCWACGEPKRSAGGQVTEGIRRNSYWCATLPVISPAHATQLVAFDPAAEPAKSVLESINKDVAAFLSIQLLQLHRCREFLEALVNEGGELAFCVEMSTRTPTPFKLSASLARQLGALGAAVEFEFI